MNKKLLLAGLSLLTAAPLFAQDALSSDNVRKWDPKFDAFVAGQSVPRMTSKGIRTITPQSLLTALVETTDAETVAAFVTEAGFSANIIDPNIVTVTISAGFIKTLAERDDVIYVNATRVFSPSLSNARPETGVTKVTAGEGLETPFTGKGVVLGVIDQGFEYDHLAFKDRVVRYAQPIGTLTTRKPSSDPYDEVGHATHVANIAGGNKVSGTDLEGVATGSELILASSSFESNNIMNLVKAIKTYADGEGKPWVINMSFGGLLGPHDGSTTYDKTLSNLCGEGGILVAAMGNEGGEKIHAYREFNATTTTHYLYYKANTMTNPDKNLYSDVFSSKADGQKHLEIAPVIIYNRKRYQPTAAQLSSSGCYYATGIDKDSQRQYATFQGSTKALSKTVCGSTNGNFMWEVKGGEGDSFHSWLNSSLAAGEFAKTSSITGTYQAEEGDDRYIVGEGAASIPRAIAVASYNAADHYMAISASNSTPRKIDYSSSVGGTGAISKFSSNGPFLGAAAKPAVAAPGGVVLSALSKNATYFNASGDFSHIITNAGKKFYYGCKSGTSMATPMVSGIIALWLEACPTLTPEQIIEVIKKTGRKDDHTGEADDQGWNYRSGYGKIDAYEGLKEVLNIKAGINEMLNSEAPVTLQKSFDDWKVLFNNDESFADIRIYTTGGNLVKSEYIPSPRCGQETVISLDGFAPGVYLFKIQTTASTMTRKVIVK